MSTSHSVDTKDLGHTMATEVPKSLDYLYDSTDVESTYGEDVGDEKALLGDVESQTTLLREKMEYPSMKQGAEYSVATRLKAFHLSCWFGLNLVLTLYNKAILQGFKFPWLMTAVHCTMVSIGCSILMLSGVFSLTRLKTSDSLILIAFSFLFTINIAISNVSLALVSVPTHQILRSTSPAIMVLTYRVLWGRSYATHTYLSLAPVILGVGLATYGDYYYTLNGFLVTMLGVFLGVAKAMTSNRIMTGSLRLSAYEVLFRMSPLAAMQSLVYCWASGEAQKLSIFVSEGNLTRPLLLAIIGNGVVAFALNVSSFQTNKVAGALTMTVAANIKQCLTILLGIFLFNVLVTPLNGFGMLVTMIGAGWYSKVELDTKGRR